VLVGEADHLFFEDLAELLDCPLGEAAGKKTRSRTHSATCDGGWLPRLLRTFA
jgi:hypothetical protein